MLLNYLLYALVTAYFVWCLLVLLFGAAAAANLYFFRRYDRWLKEREAER